MPFSGGVFTRAFNWVADKTNLINITASRMDAEMDGMATALSTCVLKDGTQTITNDIPMSSHKFTGLSDGTTTGESVHFGQVASETSVGLIELATAAEVAAGTDATRAVTVANLPCVKLASASVSGATSHNIALPTGYQFLDLMIDNFVNVNNNVQITLRISTDGGSSFISTFSYYQAATRVSDDLTSAPVGATGAAQVELAVNMSNTNNAATMQMRIPTPQSTSRRKFVDYSVNYRKVTNGPTNVTGMWTYDGGNDDFTHLQIISSSGNISFDYRIIGWR